MATAMENAIVISASFIRKRLEEGSFETAEETVKAAMVAARNSSNTWMLGSDDDKFKAAVVAAHPFLKEEDQTRLKQELDFFKVLGAATSGVPVDFSAVLAGVDEDIKPLGLMKLWKETESK